MRLRRFAALCIRVRFVCLDGEVRDAQEVAQLVQEAMNEVRANCLRAARRHIPVEWQRKVALWLLHAEVALPCAKLILQRTKRRLEALFNVTIPEPGNLGAVPPHLLFFFFLMYVRYPSMLLKHAFAVGLASLVFWEDCDLCCETCASILMVSNRTCGHRCCRSCLARYVLVC